MNTFHFYVYTVIKNIFNFKISIVIKIYNEILSIKIQVVLNLTCAFNGRLVKPKNTKIKNFLLKKIS